MARLNSSGAFPRYDDGDVVLSLSEEPEDMLVLHSTILCLHSEFFRTSLNDTWIKNKLAGTKTFEGREVRMVRYEWEFGEETFYSNCMESDSGMLIGKRSETEPADRSQPPDDYDDFFYYRTAIAGHTIAFGLLYHQPIDMSSLVANAFGKVERPINLNLRPLFGACIIAEAARGASVYCFLPIVADRLESIITGCDRESNIAINEHPGIFLTTAYLIRSKVVYEEALRHAANKTWTCEEECGRCERSLEYPFNVLDERRGVARAHIAMHSLTAHNRLLAMDIEGWEYPSLSADKKWLLSYLWRDWLQKKIFQKQEMAYGDFRVKETCLRAKSLVQIENGKLKVLSAVTSGIFEQRPAIQPSSSYHQTSLKVSATASQKPQESLSTCFLMATPLRHNGSIILLRRLRDYTYPWEEKGE